MPTVIIYWSPGRNTEQKERVVTQITDALVEHGSARREDVLIIFQTIEADSAARGGVILKPSQRETGTLDEAGDGARPTRDES
jgi:4-oxalocrotonate tautomerase family enzyme